MKSQTVSSLKKKLDKVFSIYIRNRDGGRCFTCRVVLPVAQMQAGHYVSRSHNNTRYDEINVNCQCVGCNVFKHGNMDVYALRLQARHGSQILKDLQKRKNVIKQFTTGELLELINLYATKITDL